MPHDDPRLDSGFSFHGRIPEDEVRHKSPETIGNCKYELARMQLSGLDISSRNNILTHALEQRYDALNLQIAAAENILRSLKPPHGVWHSYDEEHGQCDMLGFTKINDQWRIAYGTSNLWQAEIDNIRPLADCPITVRVAASRHLRELHLRIIEAKERYLPTIDSAIQDVMSFCQTFAPTKPHRGTK